MYWVYGSNSNLHSMNVNVEFSDMFQKIKLDGVKYLLIS